MDRPTKRKLGIRKAVIYVCGREVALPLKLLARVGNISVHKIEVFKFYSYYASFIVMLFDTFIG